MYHKLDDSTYTLYRILGRKDINMVSSIEREFKTLLTPDQYEHLLDYFQLNSDQAITQTNHYYDTVNSQFKSINAALRLRVFQDQTSEWTIKQQLNEIDSLELTQINQETIHSVPTQLTHEMINTQEIQDFIQRHAIRWDSLQLTQSFKTIRHYIQSDKGLYALDRTEFKDATDYELELETEDLDQGLAQFNALLEQFQIPYQQANTKLARAFNYSIKE